MGGKGFATSPHVKFWSIPNERKPLTEPPLATPPPHPIPPQYIQHSGLQKSYKVIKLSFLPCLKPDHFHQHVPLTLMTFVLFSTRQLHFIDKER